MLVLCYWTVTENSFVFISSSSLFLLSPATIPNPSLWCAAEDAITFLKCFFLFIFFIYLSVSSELIFHILSKPFLKRQMILIYFSNSNYQERTVRTVPSIAFPATGALTRSRPVTHPWDPRSVRPALPQPPHSPYLASQPRTLKETGTSRENRTPLRFGPNPGACMKVGVSIYFLVAVGWRLHGVLGGDPWFLFVLLTFAQRGKFWETSPACKYCNWFLSLNKNETSHVTVSKRLEPFHGWRWKPVTEKQTFWSGVLLKYFEFKKYYPLPKAFWATSVWRSSFSFDPVDKLTASPSMATTKTVQCQTLYNLSCHQQQKLLAYLFFYNLQIVAAAVSYSTSEATSSRNVACIHICIFCQNNCKAKLTGNKSLQFQPHLD